MKLNPTHKAIWVDLIGYDGSLTETILRRSASSIQEPSEMAITTVFASQDTLPGAIREVNQNIAKYLLFTLKRKMLELARNTADSNGGAAHSNCTFQAHEPLAVKAMDQ